MPDPRRPLRLDAVELLRQPGAVREVVARFVPIDLDVAHDHLDDHIDVELTATSGDAWIDVAGTVSSAWSAACRRCLTDIDGRLVIDIDERYRRDDEDPDAFVIDGPQLDLAPMVREVVLLELDDERVCRDDCAGLCPTCGVDRNGATCDCVSDVTDDRWAALADLVLDDTPATGD